MECKQVEQYFSRSPWKRQGSSSMEVLRKAWRLLSMEGRKTTQSYKPEVGRESMDTFRRASSIVWPGAAGALRSETGLHRWEVPGREVSPRAAARAQWAMESLGVEAGRSLWDLSLEHSLRTLLPRKQILQLSRG